MATSSPSVASSVLGFPRMGAQRELKFSLEAYWAGKQPATTMLDTAAALRRQHWQLQRDAGVSVIASNDASLYDHTLDHALLFSAIPQRFTALIPASANGGSDVAAYLPLYFAMARGFQGEYNSAKVDVQALEMKKWMDTNYHHMVPELLPGQSFTLNSAYIKPLLEWREAKEAGVETRPVLLSPMSFLLISSINGSSGMHSEEKDVRALLEALLPAYAELLKLLAAEGVQWVQIDDPALTLDLPAFGPALYRHTYDYLTTHAAGIKLQLTTYFDACDLELALSLPVQGVHVDLVRAPQQLDALISGLAASSVEVVSLGVVDGRNIWKGDLTAKLDLLRATLPRFAQASSKVQRVLVASSCSLLHSPHSLAAETKMEAELKRWLAFAVEKVHEIVSLTRLLSGEQLPSNVPSLVDNAADIADRRSSTRIHNPAVKEQVTTFTSNPASIRRQSQYAVRASAQQKRLQLPLFPTTTIGSFPQTAEVRSWRARLKAGKLTEAEYEANVQAETKRCIEWQERCGLDVLVDGEFDRTDMVEFFASRFTGCLVTQNGWVQSYGSRCVKPGIVYGDVERPLPMTVGVTQYAASCTSKPVKGMLTGPITILQWSFIRDDQPRSVTAQQIALAIRAEVADLERAGIAVIQIDEPAIREGLPLRRAAWESYLQWAVDAFLLASCGVADTTQIHTHLCYSHFEDVLPALRRMDADVLTIENARAAEALLAQFKAAGYGAALGPGLFDIHSPRVPSVEEMRGRLALLSRYVDVGRLWANPDCGLKTRGWKEVEAALGNLVAAAGLARQQVQKEGKLL